MGEAEATTRSHRTHIAVLALLLTLLAFVAVPGTAAAATGSGHGQGRLTIAEARATPLDTVVTIEGTVTTPAVLFASSYDDQGFALQDRTAGIFVSFPNTNIGVKPSRHVEVTGVLKSPDGLLMIVPASVEDVKVKGNDKPVQPTQVRTGAVGEANQGLLVRASGKITEGPIDDLPFGHKFFIDDGSGPINVYVNVGTKVDVSRLTVGQRVVVTGFSSEFDGVPEIDIRGPQDLKRLAR